MGEDYEQISGLASMKSEDRPISFEPVQLRHKAFLMKWLHEPHFREWWGEPEEEWAMIAEGLENGDMMPDRKSVV